MQGYLFVIRVIVENDDGGFYASCPDLGCIQVYGDSRDEALTNAKDAVRAYLDMTMRHGDPIPAGIVRWQGSPIGLAVETLRRLFRRRRRHAHVADVRIPILAGA